MPTPSPTHACAVSARVYFWLSVLAVVVSGCRVGPDYRRPTTPVPDAWHQQIESGTYLDAEGVRNWWTLFGDPMLDALIEHAKQNNLDLYAASQRICQARERLNISKSARWAQVASTGVLRNSQQAAATFPFPVGSLPSIDIWQLGFDVAWEPDVWGRVRRDVQASCANYQSSVEGYRDIMVSLYAEVARNYVELRTLQSQLVYARQNVAIQKAALELADLRVEGGVSPILDTYQATSNLATTEAEVPRIELGIQQSLNRLAVLLGEYPRSLHCDLLEPTAIPAVPADLPTSLPCDVVRQRPDIRQAERQLASRTAEVGVAMAELLPRFAINGSFNFSARKFSEVFSGLAYNYNVGPSFSWPLFQAGRIKANIASSECSVCEALAVYEQSLLTAAEEVENTIVGFNKERERRDALKRAVSAAESSLESVLEIYRAGNTDFQNVLDTQRTLFLAQNQHAQSQGQVVANLVSFYKALGGGWDSTHHCQPRCVRVSCPPNCPVNGPQVPIEEPSYLLDDEEEDTEKDEIDEQDADGGDEFDIGDELLETESDEDDIETDDDENDAPELESERPDFDVPSDQTEVRNGRSFRNVIGKRLFRRGAESSVTFAN